ncbi:jg19952 [Pararge aegeria aegeria]|uniref:Jg19952 protein n=1 Tax=Pararge aegeria aegeria TaxID=348720 RepID=A0A8S4RYU1_9NEOP|nr:jg19952 [Pararge aegeria aegeria]
MPIKTESTAYKRPVRPVLIYESECYMRKSKRTENACYENEDGALGWGSFKVAEVRNRAVMGIQTKAPWYSE